MARWRPRLAAGGSRVGGGGPWRRYRPQGNVAACRLGVGMPVPQQMRIWVESCVSPRVRELLRELHDRKYRLGDEGTEGAPMPCCHSWFPVERDMG